MGILPYKSQTDDLMRLNVSFLQVNIAMDIDSLTKLQQILFCKPPVRQASGKVENEAYRQKQRRFVVFH
jgi:hypothetical protein